MLRVRDTGIGMSEKDIETALEPFRQLATSARCGSGGTGLGLPLTKALAEANRATLHDQERGSMPARWSRSRSRADARAGVDNPGAALPRVSVASEADNARYARLALI